MHPTNGELRAFLDDEVADGERSRIEDHLESCRDCRERRDDLLRDEEVTREALARLDIRPDAAGAREAVRRRTGRRPPREPDRRGTVERTESGAPGRPAGGRSRFARAAVIALFLGTAFAAALPGSPVREWMVTLWERAAVEDGTPATRDAPSSAGPDPGAAVHVEPADDRVTVRLLDVEPGARIRVALVEGSTAVVQATASTRFRSGAGFVEAGGVRDGARVAIPRSVGFAEVRVNGRVLLLKERENVTLPSTDPDTVGAELLFRIPPPENRGSP